jgi:hypothetical protein
MEADRHSIRISRFLLRLLDRRQRIDYLLAFLIGAWPIALWYLIGADEVETATHGYLGYWETWNWTSLAILLPAVLYALRWTTGKIMPVVQPELPPQAPPILKVLPDEAARRAMYSELRRCLVSRANLTAALAVTALVTVLDMWKVFECLAGVSCACARDWTTLYLLPDSISLSSNITFVAFAYLGQITATFIGVLVMVLFLRHNLFFVRHVYQRRWFPTGDQRQYFQIDVNDVNRCFGFRPSNEAFNTQVKGLMLAGLAMFISRFVHALQSASNIDPATASAWPAWLPQFSFPVPGQWLMALFWVLALLIVGLPSLIKLLPWLHRSGDRHADLSIDHYLQEFFPEGAWPQGPDGEPESVERVAARFARNSFWPTGDNRARILFLFSYWIFLVILLPPVTGDLLLVALTLLVYGVLAYLLTLGTFGSLRLLLRYVDDLLVTDRRDPQVEPDPPATVTPAAQKSDLKVFISYRRRETAPYARSLLEGLSEHFHREHLFMDIESIQPGVRFGQEIDRALADVDAVVALIGREWSTIADDSGRPRLHDPKDMVRYEIATALAQHKRIFPVLVGGAGMPREDDLPEPLKELSLINAVEISDTRWAYDVGVLVEAIRTSADG